MVKSFFKHVEKVAEKGEDRFMLWSRPITAIYPIFDVDKLCTELAIGETNVLTADHLIKINKMQKRVERYYKRMPMTMV